MGDQIFISHSKDDESLLEDLDAVFGKLPIMQYRASFEDQSRPVSTDLKNEITKSEGMIVILGRNAQNKTHTMIWIGWEAGIAIEAGIPIWILEDVSSNVTQPIPSFTDYVLWDSTEDDQKRTLRDVLRDEFVSGGYSTPSEYRTANQFSRTPAFGSSRNLASVRGSEVTQDINGIRCPYSSCGEEFTIRFEGPNEFNCPSCRQVIVLDEEKGENSRGGIGDYAGDQFR